MEQATTQESGTGAPIEAPTVCEAFQRLVAAQPDKPALRTKGDESSLDLGRARRARAFARGRAWPGSASATATRSRCCSRTSPSATWSTSPRSTSGAVPFTIYNSSTPEQIVHQLDNADARVIVTQQAFLGKVARGARAACPTSSTSSSIDGEGGEGSTTLADMEAGGDAELRLRRRLARGRGRGPRHAHLHVRHDRAPEGRRVGPPHGDVAAALRSTRPCRCRTRRSSRSCRWPTPAAG